MADEKQDTAPSLAGITDEFVRNIEALETSLPLVMTMMIAAHVAAVQNYNTYLEKNGELLEESEEEKTYSIPAPHVQAMNRMVKQLRRSDTGYAILPQSFIVSLVSQYDFFLGRLVRGLLLLKPQILNSSDRQLNFAQLVTFARLSDARDFVMEKEVETLIRKSHVDQFSWLEAKFSVPLTKDLPEWHCFVEVTQRRNLFVHTGGVVSSQYMEVCGRQAVPLPDTTQVGTSLDVNSLYFRSAFECVYSIGVKLAQVLWRKVVPDDIETADNCLNNVLYELLCADRFALAAEIGRFGNEILKRHRSDRYSRMLTINWAQACKWQDDDDQCLRILNEVDWSASGDDFLLCNAVLRDEFGEAATIMRRIGPDGCVGEDGYKNWPIFRTFREDDSFQQAYEGVFGKPFAGVASSEDEPDASCETGDDEESSSG